MHVVLGLLFIRSGEARNVSLGLVYIVFGAELNSQELAHMEAGCRAYGATDVGSVLHAGVEIAAAIDDADATGELEPQRTAQRDQLIADPAAAGKDIGILILIAEPGLSDFQVAGRVSAGKLETEPSGQENADPAADGETHLLLELLAARRLDQFSRWNVHTDIWSDADALGMNRVCSTDQKHATQQENASYPGTATH